MNSDPAIIEAAAEALAECGFYDNEAIAAAQTMLAAVTPLILARERKEISEQARRYAGYYLEGSDGYNSFTILAEWIEARALKEQP